MLECRGYRSKLVSLLLVCCVAITLCSFGNSFALEIQGLETRATGQYSDRSAIKVNWGVWDLGSSMPQKWGMTKIYRCEGYSLVSSAPTNCKQIDTRFWSDDVPARRNALYYDYSAAEGLYYWYKVIVCSGSCTGFSHPSNRSSGDSTVISGAWLGDYPAEPQPPVDINATKGSYQGSVAITWKGVDPRMTDNFSILRCTDVPWSSCDLIRGYDDPSAKDTFFRDFPPEAGKLYYYRVMACARGRVSENTWDHETCSLPSNPAFGWRGERPSNVPAPPNAPATINATRGKSVIRVTWSPVNDALRYEAYKMRGKTGSWDLVRSIDETSFIDKEVDSLSLFHYKVRACNGGGCGPFSGVATGSIPTTKFSHFATLLLLLQPD